jgi:hypothetical protein
MQCSGSVDFAPSARISQFTIDASRVTVAIWSSFDLALPKQLEYERNEDQHKKNLRN